MKPGPTFSGDHNWQPDDRVLFIVDAQTRLERSLISACLDEAERNHGADMNRVILKISGGMSQKGLQALADKLEAPDTTTLVPARVSWLVPSNKEQKNEPLALRHLVFGDPRSPGNLRGRWILHRDASRAQCMAGEAATIGDLKARFRKQQQSRVRDEPDNFVAFVARQAVLSLEIAEWALIGRRYKVPRFVADSLRENPGFKAAVKRLSDETGRSVEDMNSEALGYLNELVAAPSTLFVDLRARFDNWVLSLAYDKDVVCREDDLAKLRGVVQNKPTMFLFTHKTYIDSIALTAKMFEADFPMLHIFAGFNMGFAGLGLLMRRSGGIFIRRSFQDKPLYKLVLRHYIGYLMEKRFPMTWAFEGTRSRTGKLMPPRYGLLKYVLEAAYVTDARDIHVIPVTVSYDLMRDVEDYATEQTGRVKKPESLKWFIGYLSSLRRPMGRMYLDFGEAVVLEQAPDPENMMALPKIAFEVAVQANRVTPITLPAIGCLVLLGAAPRALTLEELQQQILAHVRWAHARAIRLTSDFSPERLSHVDKLANAMVDMGLLIRYDEGPDVVYGIGPDQHPMASYYRNSIIHHFVNKAILEMALVRAGDVAAEEALDVFWQETVRLRDFFKFEFFYPKKKQFRKELIEELSRIDPDWEVHIAQGSDGIRPLMAAMYPLVAHASLWSFVEAYSVVFNLLARSGPGEALIEADCVQLALKEGKQLYLQRRITSEASIGKILFANGFKLAENHGLTDGGGEDVAARRNELLRDFKELWRRLDRIRSMTLSGE